LKTNVEKGYELNEHLTWEEIWTPPVEGDAFIKAELFPNDRYIKDAAPIYQVRNAYAMWREYLPENVWLTELYPLNLK